MNTDTVNYSGPTSTDEAMQMYGAQLNMQEGANPQSTASTVIDSNTGDTVIVGGNTSLTEQEQNHADQMAAYLAANMQNKNGLAPISPTQWMTDSNGNVIQLAYNGSNSELAQLLNSGSGEITDALFGLRKLAPGTSFFGPVGPHSGLDLSGQGPGPGSSGIDEAAYVDTPLWAEAIEAEKYGSQDGWGAGPTQAPATNHASTPAPVATNGFTGPTEGEVFSPAVMAEISRTPLAPPTMLYSTRTPDDDADLFDIPVGYPVAGPAAQMGNSLARGDFGRAMVWAVMTGVDIVNLPDGDTVDAIGKYVAEKALSQDATHVGENVVIDSTAGAATESGGVAESEVGNYRDSIKWGIRNVDVRPAPPGFWGQRFAQADPAVDAYELQINPNNESYYLPHPNGGYVQFENLNGTVLQDGKLVTSPSSIYYVADKPAFLQNSILSEANRQVEAASYNGLSVEWLVSNEKAAAQLDALFKSQSTPLPIKVTYLPPKAP